ncbi:MAG: hypothetical protein KA250_07710 [Verrucomicrobiales bacterium]|nr:hypothetical protein [Verrucomicrobiales bacterium]MBP9225031.1 hypothetical protein [Verrucomicrobiales bacterium]HQZ26829.1 GDSL-type esterase/lipase family protein [Verrucomicrobiales bacterium]
MQRSFCSPLLSAFALTALFFSVSGIPPLLADETGKDPWAKDMAAFAARDAKTPPPRDCLLFTGSSSVRLWPLEKSWPGLATVNNGFGGSMLRDLIVNFDKAITPYDASVIVIYSGDNDIKKGKTAAEVTADFETLAHLLQTKKPDVPVVYIGIKPSVARWEFWPEMEKVNVAIAAFCEKQDGFFFADVATAVLTTPGTPPSADLFARDGLHLSPAGYLVWTKEVNKQLDKAGVPH